MPRSIGTLGVLVVMFAALAGLPPSGSVTDRVGLPAPEFVLPDLQDQGTELSLSEFRGRPVVVNFWASWCRPCRQEMPALAEVSRRVGSTVAFVGVNHEDRRAPALALVKETGIGYATAYDPKGVTARSYGVVGLPTTVFIGPDGEERGRHSGPMTTRALSEQLDRLFTSPGSTASTSSE